MSEPERGDRTHPGPLAPCGPPSRGRGRWARGAGLPAAVREAGRAEGGGAAPGGRSCSRARRSAAHPLEQPRHETLTAARPARLRSAGTDGQRWRRRTRALGPGAKCGRRAGSAARRGELLSARAVRGLLLHLGCLGGSGGRGAPTGWLCIPGDPKAMVGPLLGGRRSARPGAPAGVGARSIAGQEAGGCGGYSGARCVRQPCNRRRRAEAKRERRREGRASGE